MITIQRFVVNPIGENCFVLSDDETKEGVIIDCGAFDEKEFAQIEQYIEQKGIKLTHALQTHMHFDHVFGLDFLHNKYGLKPECHRKEEAIYADQPRLALQLCGVQLPLPKVGIGGFLDDGQTIAVGNLELKVMHTPGHTPGGLCFHCQSEAVLLSGDTLFQGSVGRTDTPGGDYVAEIESVKRLLALPKETVTHPGHGPSTTVEQELLYNPYVR